MQVACQFVSESYKATCTNVWVIKTLASDSYRRKKSQPEWRSAFLRLDPEIREAARLRGREP
jgi:hypothetical protein